MGEFRFGLHNEIQVPRPWGPKTEYEAYKNVVEQAVLADQVGFEWWSTVEHHFLTEFSHSTAPETLYPYVAARTENVQIVHAVRLLPYPYNHPVRMAEEAATLDLLCDGRLEFGVGRSVSWDELHGFGIDPADTRAMATESLEVILGCWTEDAFSYQGKYFNLPPRHVIPKPLQKPHPPLWMAGTSRDSHTIAGQMGVGCLSFVLIVPLDEVAVRIGMYKEAVKDAKPVGKFVNNRAAGATIVHVAETDEEARDNARQWFEWTTKMAIDIVLSVAHQVPARNPANGAVSAIDAAGGDMGSYEYLRPFLEFDKDTLTLDVLVGSGMVICGSPDSVVEQVKRYQETGIDTLLTMHQVGGIPHDKVMRSIQLFGDHVIPAIKKEPASTLS
ncbi:MAG: LLM class flavin-dependent oxidoreductase [Acidimicrobiia bacterium]